MGGIAGLDRLFLVKGLQMVLQPSCMARFPQRS